MVTYRLPPIPANTPLLLSDGQVSAAWQAFFQDLVADLTTFSVEVPLKVEGIDEISFTALTPGNVVEVASNGQLQDTGFGLNQADAVSDAGTISSVTVGAGANLINMANLNTSFTTLTTEINALKTQLNSLLANLRTAGILKTT